MNELLLARHGETEWSANGRHTSRTDLPLTDNGRRLARRLAPRLADRRFALVLTSPMRRAVETCELAGLGEEAEIRDRAARMGLRRLRRHHHCRDPAAAPRLEPVARRLPERGGRCRRGRPRRPCDRRGPRRRTPTQSLFGHGHMLRVLAARWLGLAPADGGLFALATGTLSTLGYERETAVILSWSELPS